MDGVILYLYFDDKLLRSLMTQRSKDTETKQLRGRHKKTKRRINKYSIKRKIVQQTSIQNIQKDSKKQLDEQGWCSQNF